MNTRNDEKRKEREQISYMFELLLATSEQVDDSEIKVLNFLSIFSQGQQQQYLKQAAEAREKVHYELLPKMRDLIVRMKKDPSTYSSEENDKLDEEIKSVGEEFRNASGKLRRN